MKSIDLLDHQNKAIYAYAPDLINSGSIPVIIIPLVKKDLFEGLSNVLILGNDDYKKDHFRYAEKVISQLVEDKKVEVMFLKKTTPFKGKTQFLNL